jgi:hypothetical protein
MIYSSGSHQRLEPRDQISAIRSTTSWCDNQGLFLATALFLAALSGCGPGNQPNLGPTGSAKVSLNLTLSQKAAAVQNHQSGFWATVRRWLLPTEAWAVSTADVSKIQIQVTAPDLPFPVTTEEETSGKRSGDVITFNLDVPVGSNRTIIATCLNTQGQPICQGRSDPLTLTAGQATTVDILLSESVPFVTSVSPANGATNVGFGSTIQITFSTPMVASTINTQTFIVGNSESSALVPSSVTCNTPCTIATLTPSSPLSPDTSFTIAIREGITDATGNPLFFSASGPGVSVPTTFTTGSIPRIGTVAGTVTRATDGQPLINASVRIGTTDIQSNTDESGSFTLNSVPVGQQTVVATLAGFTANSVLANVREGETTIVGISLNPVVSSEQIRIILNWGATPLDLDAHLLVPSSPPFHIFFPDSQRGTLLTSPYAELDHDDTSGFGPETITIAAPISPPPPRFSGTYCYFVHNFLNDAPLTSSEASVQVLNGNSEIARYNMPTQGAGRDWEVFRLDGATGAITTVNRISDGACGLPSSNNSD